MRKTKNKGKNTTILRKILIFTEGVHLTHSQIEHIVFIFFKKAMCSIWLCVKQKLRRFSFFRNP